MIDARPGRRLLYMPLYPFIIDAAVGMLDAIIILMSP